MSRPINFRGRPIEDYGPNKWFYGSAIMNYEDKLAYIETDGQGTVPVIWDTVGQCSNVNTDPDSDGEYDELWTGDIIEIIYEGTPVICKVDYVICGFMLVSDGFDDGYIWMAELIENDGSFFWLPDSKRIGNKYDNPELIGGGAHVS